MPYRLLKIKNNLLMDCSTEKELRKKFFTKFLPICVTGVNNTEFHTSKLYDNQFQPLALLPLASCNETVTAPLQELCVDWLSHDQN